MNTIPTDGVILKTDVLGRVKTPAARREQLLDEYERSGMSGVAFAAFVGIKYQTFATWAQQRRRRRKAAAVTKPPVKPGASNNSVRWMEAVVEQAQSAVVDQNKSPLVLHLPGGARVELSDVKQVPLAVAFARALGSPALSC
jgi:hypothetical protein